MDSSTEDLRLEAKAFCCTPGDWQDVATMKKTQLKSYIAQKEFEKVQNLRSSVFSGFHKLIGFACDTVVRGNGFVSDKIANDLPLQAAIEAEAMPLMMYLNNRMKIVFLAFNDIIQGKVLQRSMEQVEIIQEETHDAGSGKDHNDLVGSTEGHGWTTEETETIEEDIDLQRSD
jgi:hypothetical protein